MTYQELAKQLRKRQLELKIVPAELVNIVSDVDIVDSYFECAKCQKNVFADKVQKHMIEESESVDEFVGQINRGLKWHNRVAHVKN